MGRSRERLGKLPPRHKLIRNPYEDLRLSKCPRCNRRTHKRKFALFVAVEGFGPIVLGKTCRFCTPCDLVMVHQDELEHELAVAFEARAPDVVGNEYAVLGTVDKKIWRKNLEGEAGGAVDPLAHVADFKKELTLGYDPGGWRRG